MKIWLVKIFKFIEPISDLYDKDISIYKEGEEGGEEEGQDNQDEKRGDNNHNKVKVIEYLKDDKRGIKHH